MSFHGWGPGASPGIIPPPAAEPLTPVSSTSGGATKTAAPAQAAKAAQPAAAPQVPETPTVGLKDKLGT